MYVSQKCVLWGSALRNYFLLCRKGAQRDLLLCSTTNINQGWDGVVIAVSQDSSRFWTSCSQMEMTLPVGMFAMSAGWLLNTCNAQDSTQHIQLPSPKCQQWQGENTYCRPVLVHFIVHTSHQALGFKCNFWSPVGPETAFLTHSQVMLKLQVFLFWGPQSE